MHLSSRCLIILGPSLISFLDCPVAGSRRPTLFEGDIAGVNPDAVAKSISKNSAGNGVIQPYLRWVGGVIPYDIGENFSIQQQAVLIDAMDNFSSVTCVHFVPRDEQDDYLHIVPVPGDNSSCGSSNVGRWQGQQAVIISLDCVTKGVIQHELMHAVGFYHEQSRVDRDEYVDINIDNLDPQVYKDNFQKYTVDEVTDFGFSYDFGSVMHYEKNAFALDPDEWTIRPKPKYMRFLDTMGQRDGLSKTDIGKINAMYGCPSPTLLKSKPVVTTPSPAIDTTTPVPAMIETTTLADIPDTTEEDTTDEPIIVEVITTSRRPSVRRHARSRMTKIKNPATEVPLLPPEPVAAVPDRSCHDMREKGMTCTLCTTTRADGGSSWTKLCGDNRHNDDSGDQISPEPSGLACQQTVESGQTCTRCTTSDGLRSKWTKRCQPGTSGSSSVAASRSTEGPTGSDVSSSDQSCHDVMERGQTCTLCVVVDPQGRSSWNKSCRW